MPKLHSLSVPTIGPAVSPTVEALIAGTADLTGAIVSNSASILTGKAADLVMAGVGNNTVTTGNGRDIVVDLGGSDKVSLGGGDDVYIYDAALNHGAKDTVNAGVGADTMVLKLTAQEWFGAALQSDIAKVLTQMGTQTGSGAPLGNFHFSAFNLTATNFEAVRVFVDGREVTLANDPVTAVADSFAVSEGGSVAGNVLANDSVPDLVASVTVVTAPTEGQLTFAADGSFSFNASTGFDWLAAGQTHDVTFVYRVTDANGDHADATATVTITGTNDAPVVTGDVAGAVVEDVTLTASGKLTATDVDLTDTVAFAGSAVGAHGSLTIDATGAWSYALANSGFSVQHLAAGQVANDVFTVTATDSAGAVVTKDITVSITGTNDAPTIAGSYTGMVGNSGTMLTAAGKLVAADIDGDALTLTSTGTAHYGSFAVDAAGAWSYHLDPTLASYQALATGTTVTETFAVQADDGHGGLTTHAVDVNVVGLAAGPGSMTIDMTLLRDFAGFQMIPTVLGTTILTDARHSPIAITGPVSDFNIIFSTDFSTAGDFNTALTPNAHLHVIAGSPVNGANVVALTAAHLVTDLYTGLGNDLVSIWGNTAFGSSVDAGGGIDTLEINNTLSGAGQSIDASAMFTNGAIAINGNADAWHVTGFENFKFTGWNQTVIATDHNDVMTDRGQNTIYGGGGNDSIINARLGTGAHSELYGGDGNDLFLSQGAALSRDGDIVDGGAGTDGLTLWNIESFDASASSTFDVLTQTGTLHVISVENLTMYGLATDNTMIGGAGNDVISGNFGNDILSGGAGNDVVDGGYSNDTLSGDSGTNIVYGGVGDDWLNSFLGTDLLNGGVGNDTFNLAPAATDAFQTTIFIQGYGVNDGADTVNGFNADSGIGHDVISLNQIHDATGLLVASVAQVLADSTQTADGVLIDFGAGSSLMLNGLTLAQLSVDDFTFA